VDAETEPLNHQQVMARGVGTSIFDGNVNHGFHVQ